MSMDEEDGHMIMMMMSEMRLSSYQSKGVMHFYMNQKQHHRQGETWPYYSKYNSANNSG